MFIPFDKISEKARTWIFASEKELNAGHKEFIRNKLQQFTSNWQSHNKDVLSSFQIIDNYFIIIAADEDFSDISGCGIDKSMHIIQEIEQSIQVSLTNKALLHFQKDNLIKVVKLSQMKTFVSENEILPTDIYYNILVSNTKEVREHFRIPAISTWLKKYFTDQEIKIIP